MLDSFYKIFNLLLTKTQGRCPQEENLVQNLSIPNREVDVRDIYMKYVKPFFSEEGSILGEEKEKFIIKAKEQEIMFRFMKEKGSFCVISELISDLTSMVIKEIVRVDAEDPQKTSAILLEELE